MRNHGVPPKFFQKPDLDKYLDQPELELSFSIPGYPHGPELAQPGRDFELIPGLLALVDDWSIKTGAISEARISLRLVLEELLLNLAMHAAHGATDQKIEVHLAICPVYEEGAGGVGPIRFQLLLDDTGPEFNPLEHRPAQELPPDQIKSGGHGLNLVRLLTCEGHYERTSGHNRLRLSVLAGDVAQVKNWGGAYCDSHQANPDFSGLKSTRWGRLKSFWQSTLAIKQAAVFFLIASVTMWGILGFYFLIMDDFRQNNSQKLYRQALKTQDVISSAFLLRIANHFQAFLDELAQRPDYDQLLASDEGFFDELKNGVLIRSITADLPVQGLVKGRLGVFGATLIHKQNQSFDNIFLPVDFEPWLKKSMGADVDGGGVAGARPAQWVGPFRELPGQDSGRHAGMFIGQIVKDDGTFLGLIIDMPWIAETLNGLSGFSDVTTIYLTDDAEYVIYPPDRGRESGPQGLAEEVASGLKPAFKNLITAIKKRQEGLVSFADLFDDGQSPWPLAWTGPSSLAYGPMSIPGWSFVIAVSSEEIEATAPSLPLALVLVAIFGPFLLTFLAFKITAKTVEPLSQLTDALEHLAGGDLDRPLIAPKSRDEISRLLLTFEKIRVTLKLSFANLLASAAAQERLRSELHLARCLQESMLPQTLPDFSGFQVATHITMAEDVCGDLFDVFTLPTDPDHLYCLIGDVCGHGIPASIIMSRAMTLGRSSLLSGRGPADTLAYLNEALLRHNDSLMFVTLLIVKLNRQTGWVTWTSAGHPPPILSRIVNDLQPDFSQGQQPWSDELVLGVRDKMMYTEHQFKMAPRQRLFLYTDGAEEAMGGLVIGDYPRPKGSSDGLVIFGQERLEATFQESCEKNRPGQGGAEEIISDLCLALATHCGNASPFDDISLVVIDWLGSSEA